jgi:hypothetical protein
MEVSNATSLRQSGITILQSSVTGEADRNTALATDVIALCSKKSANVLKNLFVRYFLKPTCNAHHKEFTAQVVHLHSYETTICDAYIV